MKIREIVQVNLTDEGITIKQSASDDRILLNLLRAKRDSIKDEKLAKRIQELINDLPFEIW